MLITVTPSATPGFNGSAAAGEDLIVFELALGPAVTSSTIAGIIPGQRVIFCITQPADPVAFVYPASVLNPSDISQAPNSTTVQEFVCRSGGNLNPVGPATYN